MQHDQPRNLILLGDAPKRAISEDLFGLREIAKALAEVVRSRVSADGYAIGIEGTWGSGKTTLLNFVAEILDSSRAPITKLSGLSHGWSGTKRHSYGLFLKNF